MAPEVAAELYQAHGEQLRRFLVGVLKDGSLAGDCVQAAFAKLLAAGGAVEPGARKSWLFRVALNEAILARRRGATAERVLRKVRREESAGNAELFSDVLVRGETVEAVRKAMSELPSSQREVVRLRIYEEMKFREIAERLNVPLGTVLARMRAALAKMRAALDSAD